MLKNDALTLAAHSLAQLIVATGETMFCVDAAMVARYVGRAAADPDAKMVEAVDGQSNAGVIAIIPIQGILVPRAYRDESGMLMGVPMDRLRNTIRAAASNPDVTTIALDVDSPGGTAYGTPETAAVLREAAQVKRVIAVANTVMGSGAYWICSQSGELHGSPSADIGSVGVYMMHMDFSKAMEDMGVKATFISAGQYKVEANPFEPLSAEAAAYRQNEVDETYDQFVREVAKGRGTTPAKVKSDFGEGRMMSADKAVAAGMADRVMTMSDVLLSLVNRKPARRRSAMAFL